MPTKHSTKEHIVQASDGLLSNASKPQPSQERPLSDTVFSTGTQRPVEHDPHNMTHQERNTSPNIGGRDEHRSLAVPPGTQGDVPSDDEFAAVAADHPEAEEASCPCSAIMSKDPVCCVPSDPSDVVGRLMVTEDIGSIPVVHDLRGSVLVGIVTDRDLVVKVVAEGLDPKTVAVGEVMTLDPFTCRAESNVRVALDAMAEYQLRRIPIVDDHHRLVGIIAQADVAARLACPTETARVVEEISHSNMEQSTAERQ